MPALFPFNGFPNEVVEKKIDSILLTKLDVNQFMTADFSLAENEGMIKKIRTYIPTDAAEDLERGDGNSIFVDAAFVEREYRVGRTQAQARYYDQDMMEDPMWVNAKVEGMAESMVNDWSRKAVKEFSKTSNQAEFTTYALADWADALAKYNNVFENEDNLFFLAAVDLVPQIRKVLGDELKYVEPYIRTGAIGTILGVPIYTSKAIPKGLMFLANRDAVHAFLKKQTFVEQDHNIDTKLNRIVASKYAVIALYDERKCIACGAKNAQDTTITAAVAGTAIVSGAAPTGATVSVYVNEKLWAAPVVAAGNAYSVTGLENLKADDRVRVVAEIEEYLPGVAQVVVA